MDAWKEPNSRFETVLLPAIKAPKVPMKGDKMMKNCPVSEAAVSARRRGMLWISNGFLSEIRNNWTSARMKRRVSAGFSNWWIVFESVCFISLGFVLNIIAVKIIANKK